MKPLDDSQHRRTRSKGKAIVHYHHHYQPPPLMTSLQLFPMRHLITVIGDDDFTAVGVPDGFSLSGRGELSLGLPANIFGSLDDVDFSIGIGIGVAAIGPSRASAGRGESAIGLPPMITIGHPVGGSAQTRNHGAAPSSPLVLGLRLPAPAAGTYNSVADQTSGAISGGDDDRRTIFTPKGT